MTFRICFRGPFNLDWGSLCSYNVYLQHYTDLPDIKRVIVNTHAIEPQVLNIDFKSFCFTKCDWLVADIRWQCAGTCWFLWDTFLWVGTRVHEGPFTCQSQGQPSDYCPGAFSSAFWTSKFQWKKNIMKICAHCYGYYFCVSACGRLYDASFLCLLSTSPYHDGLYLVVKWVFRTLTSEEQEGKNIRETEQKEWKQETQHSQNVLMKYLRYLPFK